MTDEAYWYVIRTSGLAAWFGAGMSILLGILAASRIGRRRIRSRSIVLLHRWLSAATISLLFVHVGALFPETYATSAPVRSSSHSRPTGGPTGWPAGSSPCI